MRKLLTAALLLGGLLAGAGDAFAMKCPTMVGPTTKLACTQEVYNDSGSDLTSGTVVVWDNDDTEYDRNGYPYVTTTTTADLMHVAGVVADNNCISGTMCQIVVRGWAWTQIADSTDAVAEDDLVGTTTVAGQAGGYAAGTADNCALGHVLELRDRYDAVDDGLDGQVFPVWVNIQCE